MVERLDLTVQEVLGNTTLTGRTKVLYHYTSLEAFEKIIKSKCMYFTHISYLNDYSEFDWGLNLFQETILTKVASKGILTKNSLKKFLNIIRNDKLKDNPCVGSFTALNDSLSQWRGYGDRGTGICIGFDTAIVATICKENNFIIGDVLYGDSFDGACSNFLQKISSFIRVNNSDLIDAAAKISMLISLLACFVKHPGFQEEKEIRVVVPFLDSLKTKIKGNLEVPYFVFDFKNIFSLIFKEIWIGPAADQDVVEQFILSLLKDFTLDGLFKISNSDIPYRIT